MTTKPTAERLRDHRIEARLTQKALAELADAQQDQISRYECGEIEPSLPTLRKLAVALDVPVTELIDP